MSTAGRRSSAARQATSMMLAALLVLQPTVPLLAGPNEQAARMHNRLAGVPPSSAVLSQMAALISNNNPQGAAQLAMNNSGFYNVTLRNFIAPATNRAQSRPRSVQVPRISISRNSASDTAKIR